MMSELAFNLHCKVCGGYGEVKYYINSKNKKVYYVVCPQCKAQGPDGKDETWAQLFWECKNT